MPVQCDSRFSTGSESESIVVLVLFCCLRSSLFFFFQAEDGIRDVAVTGVQTCALPISTFLGLLATVRNREARVRGFTIFQSTACEEAQEGSGTVIPFLPLLSLALIRIDRKSVV